MYNQLVQRCGSKLESIQAARDRDLHLGQARELQSQLTAASTRLDERTLQFQVDNDLTRKRDQLDKSVAFRISSNHRIYSLYFLSQADRQRLEALVILLGLLGLLGVLGLLGSLGFGLGGAGTSTPTLFVAVIPQ